MVQLRERIGSTLFLAYFSTAISQVASQLYFFLVFGFLPIQEVGIYSWAIAIATIYSYVMDLGLATYLVGELSRIRYSRRQVILVIFILRAPLVLLGWLLLWLWSWAAAPSNLEYEVLSLVTLAYIMQLFEVGLISWFQVREHQNTVNILALVMPLGRLLGIALLHYFRHALTLLDIAWLSMFTQVASTLCFVLVAVLCKTDSYSVPDVPQGVSYLLRGFRQRSPKLTIMYSLIALQSRLDWLLVSSFISKGALAYYSLANKIIEFAILLAGIGARTTFPWQSRMDADEPHLKAQLGLIRKLVVLSSALLCAGLFFLAPQLVSIFFDNKYAGADGAIRLLTLGGAIFMLNQYLFYSVLAHKLEGEYTWLIVVATLAQVILDITLMPYIGIRGAAVGMLAMGLTLHLGQFGLFLHKHILERSEVMRIEAFLVASLALVSILWLESPLLVMNTILSWLIIGVLGLVLILNYRERVKVLNGAYHVLYIAFRYPIRLLRS
jgi:O-antigen/teichoic acid export membrane protein